MKRLFLIILASWLLVVSYSQQVITPTSALDAYLNNGDPTWAWEIRQEYAAGTTRAYSIFFISQKWHDILWKHELIVFVPEKIEHDGALLFITGGSIDAGMPRYVQPDANESRLMANIAERNSAVTAVLRQTPNQPLYDGRTEDALISYTLNEFRKDGDFSWPLLFPMVKGASKAMDVIQEFTQQYTGTAINRFVISGASKRGWTTWLTGASNDSRVVALAPMVIDILNMPATLTDQQKDYNYSEQIADYVELEIPQAVHSEFGNSIVQMIDPFSYLSRLTMPKMIFMGTNDPYWTIDAIKHYIEEIPGHNILCYIPNVGHNLGDGQKAFSALSAFFDLTLNNKPYPSLDLTMTEKTGEVTLNIKISNNQPTKAIMWTAESSSRDFRQSKWTDKVIASDIKDTVILTVAYPQAGYNAFYVELVCKDSKGNEYSYTTRTFVLDTKRVN